MFHRVDPFGGFFHGLDPFGFDISDMIPALVDAEVPQQQGGRRRGGRRQGQQQAIGGGQPQAGDKGMEVEEKKEAGGHSGAPQAGAGGQELATQQRGGELSPFEQLIPQALAIRVDMEEDEKALRIKAEVPGVPKENVKVTARGNLLTIQAEKKEEKKEEDPNRRVLRRELVYGVTTRTIRLPKDVDPSQMKARMEQGLLIVEIPKKPEARPQEHSAKIQ